MGLLLLAQIVASPPALAQTCCKICSSSQPCGDGCISRKKKCRKPKGCACASAMLHGAPAVAFAAKAEMELQARVVRVIDGDSLRVRVIGWPKEINPVELRLVGIDTPETPPRARCEAETALAKRAKDMTARLAPAKALVTLAWEPHRYDGFGRMLVRVRSERSSDIAEELLKAGLARRYNGGRRDGWCG